MEGFILASPGRVLFSLGGFEIYTYGLCIAFAIFVGTVVSNLLVNSSRKLPKDIFLSIIPFLVFFGIIGARLWYCALNYKEFIVGPLEILNLRTGGISIHGAILGGFIYLWVYSKIKKISLISLCDYATIGLVLGQAIGRLGNFFNNEAFGIPYDGLIKLFVPLQNRPLKYKEFEFFHPTFLYEMICDLIIFAILLILVRKKEIAPGVLTLVYLILYSFIRFFIELIRVDSNLYIFNLPFPALISLIIFIASFIFFVIKRYK